MRAAAELFGMDGSDRFMLYGVLLVFGAILLGFLLTLLVG